MRSSDSALRPPTTGAPRTNAFRTATGRRQSRDGPPGDVLGHATEGRRGVRGDASAMLRRSRQRRPAPGNSDGWTWGHIRPGELAARLEQPLPCPPKPSRPSTIHFRLRAAYASAKLEVHPQLGDGLFSVLPKLTIVRSSSGNISWRCPWDDTLALSCVAAVIRTCEEPLFCSQRLLGTATWCFLTSSKSMRVRTKP